MQSSVAEKWFLLSRVYDMHLPAFQRSALFNQRTLISYISFIVMVNSVCLTCMSGVCDKYLSVNPF